MPYLRRRFCPPPERFHVSRSTRVPKATDSTNSRRRHLGDARTVLASLASQRAMAPAELTEKPVGRKLVITLPEGDTGSVRWVKASTCH